METIDVFLEGRKPYGFQITGGIDFGMPLRIATVREGGKAEQAGVATGQRVVRINGKPTMSMSYMMAQNAVRASAGQLHLTVYGKQRTNPSSPPFMPLKDTDKKELEYEDIHQTEFTSDHRQDDEKSVDSQLTSSTDTPRVAGVTRSVYRGGRFRGPWSTHVSTWQWLKMKMSEPSERNLPSQKVLDETLPVLKPNFDSPPETGLRVTWLGHATTLVELDGMTILTDPVFSPNIGLFNAPLFQWYKRFRPAPCKIKDLPQINAVIISHSHYDHLDYKSVRNLHWRYRDSLHWFIPAGLKSWFEYWIGCKNIHELDWGEEECIPGRPDVRFVFTPTQHWSGRGACDKDQSLWGGWCILGPSKRFYFAGDTGYCQAFKEIGNLFGPFDLAAIPIGAYRPRWFYHAYHVDPPEAVKIHQDVKSKKSIGIHWGTLPHGNEFYLEPREYLQHALKEKQVPLEDFVTLNHGESMILGDLENLGDLESNTLNEDQTY